MILYLLFLTAFVALAGAAIYARGAGAGEDAARTGRKVVVLIGGAEALIYYLICLGLYDARVCWETYAVLSAVLAAAVWFVVDGLLKSHLTAEGIFHIARKMVLFVTAGIILSCPVFVVAVARLNDFNPGSGVAAVMWPADSVEEFSGEDCGDEVFVMQDSIGCDGFYDQETVVAEVDPAGTYDGEAVDEADAGDGEADEYAVLAPGISNWSNCELFFLAGAGTFRAVNFFINDGDRCIRVMTSPADMFNTYSYVNTADGLHCFRRYRLTAEPLKMETADLAGNPMTVTIPVISGSTKYGKEYSDSYVFIAEDASVFISDGESYSCVGKDDFWKAWKSCFGENWHLAAGRGGDASVGSQEMESGSISDYSVNKCKHCGGSGLCPRCGGKGYVDFMGDVQECPSCRGFKHCFNCGGSKIQI